MPAGGGRQEGAVRTTAGCPTASVAEDGVAWGWGPPHVLGSKSQGLQCTPRAGRASGHPAHLHIPLVQSGAQPKRRAGSPQSGSRQRLISFTECVKQRHFISRLAD